MHFFVNLAVRNPDHKHPFFSSEWSYNIFCCLSFVKDRNEQTTDPGSSLFAIPSTSWMHWCMLKQPCSNSRMITAIISGVTVLQFNFYGNMDPSNLSLVMRKTCLLPNANNKGTDQPAHPCSLISTFVVCCLDSIIPLLAKSKISRL